MSKCEICGRELGLNEDHRDCVIRDYAKCIEDLEQHQIQKAIECLYDMYDYIIENDILKDIPNFYGYHILSEYIDNKIKELENE